MLVFGNRLVVESFAMILESTQFASNSSFQFISPPVRNEVLPIYIPSDQIFNIKINVPGIIVSISGINQAKWHKRKKKRISNETRGTGTDRNGNTCKSKESKMNLTISLS